MATSSFSKDFIVSDTKAIEDFKKASENPIKINVKTRNYEEDRVKGIELLTKLAQNFPSQRHLVK